MANKLDMTKEDLYGILGVEQEATEKHAAYDKILKGKKEAEWRRKQYDSKRKKFKDDLEVREKATFEKKEDAVDAAKRLQQEIERLRKEGNSILRETQEQLRRDLEERQNSAAGQQPEDRLGNHGNSDSTETRKATGTSGAASFPTGATSFTSFSQTQPLFSDQPTPDNRDFESVVLMKMRQAEERKRLIEQMMKEDEEG
ncbi:DJC17-like protein [Mya arenaria]|uniref:DJC17-like protein n=1 Tax=Mya arenaria TaxID=6604 RepID=A0ABY7FCJ8_MYAAR|nr:DJC17-like protein [Mya arenaria]